MKYLKYTLYIALIAMVTIACEVNTAEFPIDTDELRNSENTGGFLRVVASDGTTFNVLDLENQAYSVTLEADDAENGGQLESVEFFVGFQDNSVGNVGDIDVSADPIRTFSAADFSEDAESGLPRVSTTFTSAELLGALGLETSQIGVNSAILVRWTLNLDNGQSFNADNSGGNITGGAFFSSPFAQNIAQSVAIPADQFVGAYTITQDAQATGGVIGGFGDGWFFGPDATATVEITVDPDNTLNGRVFDPDEGGYLDGAGFGTELGPITIAFSQDPQTGTNFTTVSGAPYGTGIQCTNGISVGPPEEVSAEGVYTSGDDSEFTLTIVDDITNDCGLGAFPITFTFTKQ